MLITPKHEIYSTNKKLALSLAVVAGAVLLISVGVWLEGVITDSSEQTARLYQTAIQVSDDIQLNYSIDTKQGRILAETTISAVDLVKFPEMNKEFPQVHKEEETYTKHSREECTYDEDGNVEECHNEYYYTWDTTNEWFLQANQVDMAGRKYPFGLFSLGSNSIDAKDIINGETGHYVVVEKKGLFDFDLDLFKEADEGDIRYSYDVLQLPKSGTVFLNVAETVRPALGNKIDLYTKKPQELVKDAQNDAQIKSTVFTVFWVILVLCEIGFGGYAVYNYEEY